MTLRLRNARLEDGSSVDVTIDGARITSVDPVDPVDRAGRVPGRPAPTDGDVDGVGDDVDRDVDGDLDLTGYLLLVAPAEPHAHLDKALTADAVPNPAGDLAGAIEAWLAHRSTITKDDFIDRATRAAELSVANGCTALRTHVDLGVDIGTTGVEALLEVKAALAPVVDLQLVGLVAGLTSPGGTDELAVMRDALDMGLDVVGGVPHIEMDPARSIDLVLELAAEYERPIDLHADENLDPGSCDLETLARRVSITGFDQPVVASHCVALAMKPETEQRRIAEAATAAGVAVVALPQTNLYLQARNIATAPPRGLTALAALHRAGTTVAGGGDNLRDPFCPVGRADPLETASLLVMAGHLSPAAAYHCVSGGARAAMGLEPVTISAGRPAELLAIAASSIGEAVGAAPADRLVIHHGRVLIGRRTVGGGRI